jgi:hypothetical protein
MSKWKVRVPGYLVWEMYGTTEKDVRKQIREKLDLQRVPRGTWIDKVDEEREKLEHNAELYKDVLEQNSWLCLTDLM